MHRIWINTGTKRYSVLAGPRVISQLGRFLKRQPDIVTAFVLYDAQVFALFAPALQRRLSRTGLAVAELAIPRGERSKSEGTLRRVYSFLLDQGISRSDVIVAVGGGVVTDLAGYAAATTMRGIRWLALPTTLLSMVDAAIGGKVGINHPRGKNLIGAFWQPDMVLCDTCFLQTLPRRHLISGLGEVAKYAGLIGGPMISLLESLSAGDFSIDAPRLERLISRSIEYKSVVVLTDEREEGQRILLNLGHTFGHAFEKSAGYGRLLHGEALVYGLWSMLNLSETVLRVPGPRLQRYRQLLCRLAEEIPKRAIDLDKTMEAMELDKKRIGRENRFVLLRRPGQPAVVRDVPRREVRRALTATLREFGLQGG